MKGRRFMSFCFEIYIYCFEVKLLCKKKLKIIYFILRCTHICCKIYSQHIFLLFLSIQTVLFNELCPPWILQQRPNSHEPGRLWSHNGKVTYDGLYPQPHSPSVLSLLWRSKVTSEICSDTNFFHCALSGLSRVAPDYSNKCGLHASK